MLDNGSYKLVSKCISAIVTVSANSVDSDLGCTSKIYFDNVTLTLRHRNHANTITSVITAKQTIVNEVYVYFFNKISLKQYFIEKYILHLFC